MDIYLMRKAAGKYFFAEDQNTFNPQLSYDLELLATYYPTSTFLVVNDESDPGFHNVFTKGSIFAQCGMDEQLTVPCQRCTSRRPYSEDHCAQCDAPMSWSVLCKAILGEDYHKALVRDKVTGFFQDGGRTRGFEPYRVSVNDLEARTNPLLKAIAAGAKPGAF